MSQDVESLSPAATPAPEKSRARWKGVLTVLLAIAFSLLVVYLTTRYHAELRGLGRAGYLGLFLISILGNATIIIPAPVFVVACAAGMIYGPLVVGLISGLGSAIGELTGYYAGYGGSSVIPEGKLYEKLAQFMREHGILAIFILAVVPNPLFDVGGMIAGILKMPVLRFLFAAWIGKAVRLGVMAYLCLGGLPFLQHFIGR
jgi:membrane protein YqaA with SNARE-associated domain